MDSSRRTRISASAEFLHPVKCEEQMTGFSSEIRLAGHVGTITFPERFECEDKSDVRRSNLVGPGIAKAWKLHRIFGWGSRIRHGISAVGALLEFDVEESSMSEVSSQISKAFGVWRDLFAQYVEILTRQRSYRTSYSKDDNCLRFVHRVGDSFEWCEEVNRQSIVVVTGTRDEALRIEDFRRINSWCCEGRAPSLEYRVQLEAYRALLVEDFRKAVVDTSTAAEVALSNAIRRHFVDTGISYGESLLDGFRMLSNRIRLASLIGLPLPEENYQRSLVEPRNRVVHRAEFVDATIARDAVRAVDHILQAICPRIEGPESAPACG